ncbi:hypothetical protein Anas_11010 [Armadillidium nasatum]|uniref:Uncharacterized protein n=1 Tax=Armadillidium nasatum TaxID=96803 RepID=A0A5N5SNH9_9CRUS|nr:hypothetical protein Anas_11010 [Armadillidium nasatum]
MNKLEFIDNRKKRKRQKQSKESGNSSSVVTIKEHSSNQVFNQSGPSALENLTKELDNRDKEKEVKERKRRRKGRKRKRKRGKILNKIRSDAESENSISSQLSGSKGKENEKSSSLMSPPSTSSTEGVIISSSSSENMSSNQTLSKDISIPSENTKFVEEKNLQPDDMKNHLSSLSSTRNHQSTSSRSKPSSSSETSMPTSTERSAGIPAPVEKGRDILQDIINRMKNKNKIAPNIIDAMLENDSEKKHTDKTLEKNQVSKLDKKKSLKSQRVGNKKNAKQASNQLGNDLIFDTEYDNNISGYKEDYKDPIDSYPDIYKSEYSENDNKSLKGNKVDEINYYDHDYDNESNNYIDLKLEESKSGFPSPEKRLYDEDNIKEAKERGFTYSIFKQV